MPASIKLSIDAKAIESLRKLHAAAPAGDWRYSYAHVTAFGPNGQEEHIANFTRVQNRGQNTAAFIAEAHAAFPALLDLAEEALRLRAAVETFATKCEADAGDYEQLARRAYHSDTAAEREMRADMLREQAEQVRALVTR